MARIRTIKPDFWTDGHIIGLTPWARLLYIGMWNFSLCDRGHLPDDPVGLKLRILPADDVDSRALLDELLIAGRVVRRGTADGRTYLLIPRLPDHQKSDPRWQTRCPYCAAEQDGPPTEVPASPSPLAEPRRDSPEPAETPQNSAQGSKGEEGKGKEVRPSVVQRGRPRDRPATRIPDDFAVTPDMAAWARTNAPDIDPVETDAFVDYWRGAAGAKARKADWPATWRNWMRRAQADAQARQRARASPRAGLVDHNGMQLKPETVARIDDNARWQAMDQQRLAIEGAAP